MVDENSAHHTSFSAPGNFLCQCISQFHIRIIRPKMLQHDNRIGFG